MRMVVLAAVLSLAAIHSGAQAHLREVMQPLPAGAVEVVSERELPGVRPEMLDWWWNNLGANDNFQHWYPDAHLSFQWIEPPPAGQGLAYAEGAVQQRTQRIAGQVVVSRLRYLPVPSVHPCEIADQLLVAELSFPDHPELGTGTVRYQYAGNAANDGLLLRASYQVPETIDDAYPGYVAGFRDYLNQATDQLATVLPGLFQAQYLEDELLQRGSYEVVGNGWLTRSIIVDQEIKGITPEMLDWWWDNIDDTSRYKRWHPTAHRSFQWQVPPSQPDQLAYSVGAVQWVVEDIGPYRSSLLITWLDPAEAADQVEYEHWIYVKTDLKVLAGILPQRLIHEYQWNDADDGIVMRSSFTVPRFFDVIMPGFSDRLAEHALQEMQFLPNFLPELFEREYVRKDSCAQCTP